jgi:hypothetical protein
MAGTEVRPTNHLKAAAPVGAAALVIVAAVAGASLLGGQPRQNESPAIATSGASFPTIDNAAPPSALNTPDPAPGSAVPGVAFDQVTPGPASTTSPTAPRVGMEIVVKFKDDGKVKDIIDSFWKDQGSAQSKFNAFKASHPEFANLKLDRVTYSNELVLVHDGSAATDQRLAAMRASAAKLKNLSDVSYAEPNLTAHPGGQ